MSERLDHPLEEIAETAAGVIAEGGTIYQKFTCAGCGERKTMEVPNILFTVGKCDQCGHETDLRQQGCNYLAHFTA